MKVLIFLLFLVPAEGHPSPSTECRKGVRKVLSGIVSSDGAAQLLRKTTSKGSWFSAGAKESATLRIPWPFALEGRHVCGILRQAHRRSFFDGTVFEVRLPSTIRIRTRNATLVIPLDGSVEEFFVEATKTAFYIADSFQTQTAAMPSELVEIETRTRSDLRRIPSPDEWHPANAYVTAEDLQGRFVSCSQIL